MDDATLWAAFSERTLRDDEWTHRAHLRVAWMHLERWPDVDEAHLRCRIGIVRLNAAHGLEETPQRGYHETLTRVWLELVRRARSTEKTGDSEAFLAHHPHLLEREAPLRHYSRAVLSSLRARSVFVAPDVAPF